MQAIIKQKRRLPSITSQTLASYMCSRCGGDGGHYDPKGNWISCYFCGGSGHN